MLLTIVAWLVAAPVARADDEPGRVQPTAEGAGMDSVHVQPTAKHFVPPNQPDVSANNARDVDELYRQLIGPRPATPSGSGPSATLSRRTKR